ncbi:hypothetical protein OAG1_17430 [Agarivorans sp. OAG1]|nr:hypothetical protein OAG1_17430 [Agarivorans sp. OAG1]
MIALIMTGSVGERGQNAPKDVYLIKALLNAWARSTAKPDLPFNDQVDPAMLALLETFQRTVVKMGKPDRLVSANRGTFKTLVNTLKNGFTRTSLTPPMQGRVTWDAEGTEGGRFHSRILHVPSISSGLTLGRGYDMKHKTAAGILADLTKAGIDAVLATRLSNAAGLSGKAAEQFAIEQDLLDVEISARVQLALFKDVYQFHLADVKRISSKTSTVAAYGSVDWSKLPKEMIDVVVDLRYRGDYTPRSRLLIQTHLATANFADFKREIQNQANWSQVPYTRFQLRSKHLNTLTASQPMLTGVTP